MTAGGHHIRIRDRVRCLKSLVRLISYRRSLNAQAIKWRSCPCKVPFPDAKLQLEDC